MSLNQFSFPLCSHCHTHSHMPVVIRDVSNKVDIARFRLQSTTIRCDFSFDRYLHLSRLRNYGGRVHISLLLVQILSKKSQKIAIPNMLDNY